MRSRPVAVLISLVLGMPLTGATQDMYVYPQKGQNQQQQEQDESECYRWARDQSGFDPMQVPTATRAPPREKQKGGVGKGAVGGAAVGTAAGVITGKRTGKKALAGAAAGGLVGGMRRQRSESKNQRRRQDWESEQNQIYAQNRNNYNRAYAACLQGRGYTVN